METFKKRSGTTNKGIDYENLNIANIGINWSLDNQIEDFYLSSNDDNFGDFDDIVIKITSTKSSNVSALQLKHNDRGTLSIKQLSQGKGDFSLKKYCTSVQSINSHVDSFILYTNLKFSVEGDTRFRIDGEDFQIGLSPFQPKDKILQISDELNHCYKFHVVENDCTYDYSPEIVMYKHFFEKFYLFVNQDNLKTLETKIVEKFKKLFLANQTECDAFLKMISRWSQQQGEKHKLCKNWMRRAIALTLLSSRIKPLSFGSSVSKNMKILRKAISAFTVTVFENNSYHKIKDLWGDAVTRVKDTKELNKTREMYHLSPFYIKSIDDVDLKLLSTLLWLNDTCPIIVTEDAIIHKVIALCPDAKFIVLGDDVNEKFTNYECSVFRNLSDLKTSCRDSVLETFNLSIQGKEEVSLKKAFSTDFIDAIRTSYLVEMLNEPYAVGGLQENLPKPYVERYLWRNVITFKYFEKNDENTLIVVDCVQEIDSLKRKLKNCSIHNLEDYLNQSNTSTRRSETAVSGTSRISVFITTNTCQKMQFEAICDKNKDLKNYHHLRFIDGNNFEWIQSKGNVSSLEEYKITAFLLTEQEMLMTKLGNNINLIVSNPGMGKSELMKSLKNTSPPEIWTIMMNPTDMCLFSKYLTSNNQSANLETLQNFLLNEKYRCMNEGAKHFLQVFIKQNQVYYVWDALDEIPAESVETITSLIVELSKSNHVQWITSRFQLKHLLENKFNVLSLNLCQFSEQEQITYIKKRLENVDTTEEIDQIINTVRSSFALVEHTEILGIPLQIFMLTNLLRKDINKYFKLLCNIFVLTDLYHYFVEEKMKVYFEKTVGGDFKNSLYESAVKILEAAIIKYHQNLALRTLFSAEFLKRLNIEHENNFEDSKEEYISVGLLTKIISKPAHFIHNSFAEYFVALYFSQNQRLSSIFVDVIFEPRYVNVRFFFDLLLARESPAHVAVLYKNINLLEKYEHQIRTITDAGDRSVLHVASSWGQRHPRLDVATTADAYIVDDFDCPNIVAERTEDLNILNYLLNACELSQCDTLFKLTPLLYAEKSKCLLIELKILKQLNQSLLDLSVEHIINILYYTAICGYDDVIDHLNLELSSGSDRENANLLKLNKKVLDTRNFVDETLLHLAAARQFEKVVRFLVNQGANINFPDTDGATPFYFACEQGYYKIVDFLAAAGAEINRARTDGVTPLFVASEFGHVDVVKRLLALGANPNQPRHNGALPLHVACEFGRKEVTELLVAAGSELHHEKRDGVCPLFVASQFGHSNVVEYLLGLGANPNQPRDNGAIPLHVACEFGHDEITGLLIESGAEIEHEKVDGTTPLFTASQFGNTKIVERLLALNADPNHPRDTGATPLHVACEFGHVEIIELLVASGAEINRGRTDGVAPLFVASQYAPVKVLDCLLALGADPNQPKNASATPLHVACEFGRLENMERLVTSGAEINRGRTDGITPLFIASEFGQSKITERLLALGANVNQARDTGATPLHVACEFGHEAIVEDLVTSGAEINGGTTDGVTPLFVASQFGQIKIVELLLALGADPNQPTNLGAIPLHVACQCGHKEIIELLVASGAEINRQKVNGVTPLFMASQFESVKIVERLLALGANPNLPRDTGATPLHAVCEFGHEEMIEPLIASGAEINHGSTKGVTPLFVACKFGHIKVVERLLSLGANINQPRNTGATPLYIACKVGHENIVELLVASGVEINIVTNSGRSPLSIAVKKGHDRIVEILRGLSNS
ncbi:uncharacterized protein LOC135123599 [Zophobas morio]|uniref:uncharacterized protein LOC135123599 n=1 Tax=Zophobas morio TaxID=2755281 RepID=UPI003082A532